MEKSYFVMLKTQTGTSLVPMLDPDGALAMFDGPKKARRAAEQTTFGKAFGFIVFDADFDGDDV